MRNLEKEFKKRAINYSKLIDYGFEKENDTYVYKTNILDGTFEVNILISDEEKKSKLIDLESNEEYALVDVESAAGEFVGIARQEYENIINDIVEKCTTKEVFKCKQSKEIIEHIRQKYNDELEFLWEKFDDNAIWRNKQNNKWYAALLTITENKLNIDSDKEVEIIDLMYQKDKIEEIVDNKKIFPGYHMNKKSWITVKLDNTVETEKICELIDNSYNISVGKSKK